MSISTDNFNESNELVDNDLSNGVTTSREIITINAPDINRFTTPTKYEIIQQQITTDITLGLS